MLQIVNEPTRVTQTTMSLIDYCVTNRPESIVFSGVYPTSISDHDLVFAVRKVGISRGNPKFIETRSFKNFEEDNFKHDLQNAEWPSTTFFHNTEEMWRKWRKDKRTQ